MNKIKLFSLSLVALFMACFTACESKYDVDHTAELVGTWTYIGPNYAEALVIKEDGSVLSTGVEDGEYWENVAGNIVIKNNVATMTFEDGDNFKGHFDLVPGVAFTIYAEDGNHLTFNLCEEDLADEIVGMWVSTEEVFGQEESVAITTYNENGKAYLTGFSPEVNGFVKQEELDYKVVGNLMISSLKGDDNMPTMYFPVKFDIMPNGTELGDIMTTHDLTNGTKPSFLRVKQTLNLTTGQTYYYKSAYVTNAKGTDEDFTILGNTFNMANINAGNFDEIFGADLLCVELNADSIKLTSRLYDQNVVVELPIMVEGNKVILDMSDANPAFRNVDLYMFQDANDSQLHMYMSTNSFINYFANMELLNLLVEGKINPDDSTAIEKFYTDMEARVESINVSMVFKARN